MALKLPRQASWLTLDREDAPVVGAPFGFTPFQEFALGNGDVFGLYWPIGREQEEPLVAETLHDDGLLSPAFSSLERFFAKTSTGAETADDPEGHPEPPSLDEDPASPLACYDDARAALRAQDPDRAIARLEQAIETLPEYADALAALALQNLRLGRHDEACRLAVRAVIAPPCFGASPQIARVWSWLAQQDDGPDDLANDPIWQKRADLDGPPGGGAKQNDTYLAFARAIDVYVEQRKIVRALTLMQTYADFMNAETTAFQDRYGYVFAEWRDQQREVSERLPTGARVLD